MYTYTGSLLLAKQLTNNTNTTSFDAFFATQLQQYDNETVHKIPSLYQERTNSTSMVTYPGQQFYEMPQNVRRIITLSILVNNNSGTIPAVAGFNWQPEECPSMERWITLNMNQNIQSDITQYYFFYDGQVGLYPKPAVGYNQATIRYQEDSKNFSQPDYTTGTIVSVPFTTTLTATPVVGALAATLNSSWTLPTGTWEMVFSTGEKRLVTLTNGATTVTWTFGLVSAETTAVTINTSNGGSIITGNGTTWTTAMQGWYLQIAPPTGDGIYYKVDTVYSTTVLSLKKQYQGVALSSATATYLVGETSQIPEAYQVIPIYLSVAQYYETISKDEDRAKSYTEKADKSFAQMMIDFGNKSTDPTVHDDFGRSLINPNLAVNITGSSTNQ
jgi:hypothetical protein